MAVAGLGLDLCSVERIGRILTGPRGARFIERVYTEAEQKVCQARSDSASAYAARFAAKEALVKALGAPPGLRWRDIEVVRESGAPTFALEGVAKAEVKRRGVQVMLSITHDAGVAAAVVVLDSAGKSA